MILKQEGFCDCHQKVLLSFKVLHWCILMNSYTKQLLRNFPGCHSEVMWFHRCGSLRRFPVQTGSLCQTSGKELNSLRHVTSLKWPSCVLVSSCSDNNAEKTSTSVCMNKTKQTCNCCLFIVGLIKRLICFFTEMKHT